MDESKIPTYLAMRLLLLYSYLRILGTLTVFNIIEYEISFFRPQKDMPAGEEHIQHTVCINGAHKLITTTLAKFIAKTVCS